MEDFFNSLPGAQCWRLTPFLFHLITKYPTSVNKEQDDLFWMFSAYRITSINRYGCKCTLIVANRKEVIKNIPYMPKGQISVISIHEEILIELRSKRNKPYFYN